MSKRQWLYVAVLVAASLMLSHPGALAQDQNLGTDLFENSAPPEPSEASGQSLIDYPLSHYSLDYYTDVGLTNLSAIGPAIGHFLASMLWFLTLLMMRGVIELFTWAFSLDLLNGSEDTGGEGALGPVADAISSVYNNAFGREWMVVGILLAGGWGIYKALVQRRYTETTGALAKSVVFMLIALFFVNQPERTVGAASEWTNDLSVSFLVAVDDATGDEQADSSAAPDSAAQAKQNVRNQLWSTFVFDPWRVLNFGGLTVCADTDDPDDVDETSAVSCNDPAADAEHDTTAYALRYLQFEPGSDKRKEEFEALKDGDTPDTDEPVTPIGTSGDAGQFEGVDYDATDAVAVDIQQEGGGYQRLVFALLILLGALGAAILIGFLSLAVVLAQVIALVFLAFAPVALVIGIFPGRGHDFFVSWLSKLGTAVFIKAAYSLLLAIVLAVSSSLLAATVGLGFLFAFALQCLFLWAVFVYRKTLANAPLKALTGGEGSERETDRGGRGAARFAHQAVASPIHAFRRVGTRRAAYQGATAAAGGAGAVAPTTVAGQAKRSLRERDHDRRLAADAERTLRRRQRFLQAKPDWLRSNGDRRELSHLRESGPDKRTERARRAEDAARRTRQAFTSRPYSRRELREERLDIAESLRTRAGESSGVAANARAPGDGGKPAQKPRSEQSSLGRLEQETRQLEASRRQRSQIASSRPAPVGRGDGSASGRRKRKLSRVPRPKDGSG